MKIGERSFLTARGLLPVQVLDSALKTLDLQALAWPLQEHARRPLLHRLGIHDKATCVDSRDRVYALLSISTDGSA